MIRLALAAVLAAAAFMSSPHIALAAKGGFKGGIKPVPFRAHGLFAPVTPKTLSHSGLPAKFHGHHKKHLVQPVIVGLTGGLASGQFLSARRSAAGRSAGAARDRAGRRRVGLRDRGCHRARPHPQHHPLLRFRVPLPRRRPISGGAAAKQPSSRPIRMTQS